MTLLSSYVTGVYADPSISALDKFYRLCETQANGLASAATAAQRATEAPSTVHLPAYFMSLTYADVTKQPLAYGSGITYGDGSVYGGSTDLYQIALPLGFSDVEYIADSLATPTILWQNGVDFVIQDGYVRSKVSPLLKFGTVESAKLVLINVTMTLNLVQRIYGNPIEADTFNNGAVASVYWNLLSQGATCGNISQLLCLITDTDFVKEPGTVRAVYVENARNYVRTDSALYGSGGTALVSVGDQIEAGQFIFDNATLIFGSAPINPTDFPALHLGMGLLGPDYVGGVCIENVESAAPAVLSTFAQVKSAAPTIAGRTLDPNKPFETVQYTKDPYTERLQVRVLETLPFKGNPATVLKFVEKLSSLAFSSGVTLTDDVDPVNGTLNLFDTVRQLAFGEASVFIKLRADLTPAGFSQAAALHFLLRSLPAYSYLLAYQETTFEDTFSAVSETVESFFLEEATESFSTVTEKVGAWS